MKNDFIIIVQLYLTNSVKGLLMKKIKVVIDSSAPNYKEIVKALEANDIEVTVYNKDLDFDEELVNELQKLNQFEKIKMPISQKAFSSIEIKDIETPYYQKFNKKTFG